MEVEWAFMVARVLVEYEHHPSNGLRRATTRAHPASPRPPSPLREIDEICNTLSVTLTLLHHIYRLSYNLDEIRLQACSPYERPIDIGMHHEFADVV